MWSTCHPLSWGLVVGGHLHRRAQVASKLIEATDETATQPRSSEDTYPGAIQPWPGPPQRRPHRLDSVPSASKILQGTVRRRITGRISPSSLEWSSPLAGTTARPSQVPEPNRQPCAKCNPAHPPFHLSSGSAPAACPFGHGIVTLGRSRSKIIPVQSPDIALNLAIRAVSGVGCTISRCARFHEQPWHPVKLTARRTLFRVQRPPNPATRQPGRM